MTNYAISYSMLTWNLTEYAATVHACGLYCSHQVIPDYDRLTIFSRFWITSNGRIETTNN